MLKNNIKILLITLCLVLLLAFCTFSDEDNEKVVLQGLPLTSAWEYKSKGRIYRIIGVADDKVILYTPKQIEAVNVISGKLVWSYQPPGPFIDLETRNSLFLKDDLLIFTSSIESRHKKLIVLDTKTGQELWSRDDKEGYAASDIAVGDKYIYWSIWPYFLAFDYFSGEIVWQSKLNTNSSGYSGLLYENDELIVIRPDVHVLDANNGKVKRLLNFKINSTLYKIYDGVIYFFAFGKGQALDTKNDTVLWEISTNSLKGSHISWAPLFKANKLYLGLNGALTVLDTDDGQIIWDSSNLNSEAPILHSNPVFLDNTVYVIFSDGSLRILKDDDGTELGRVYFKSSSEYSNLHIANGILFMSFSDTELLAYNLLKTD